MLSIFLKDRNDNNKWDLSIWAQDHDKDNGDAGDNQKFFLKQNWIEEEKRVVLRVAIDLAGSGTVSVYWQDKSDTATFSGGEELVNKCPSNVPAECGDDWSDIDMFKVGSGGAVFGNDQDKLGDNFDYEQAFEGKFYGLKIYDKSFNLDSFKDGTLPDANLIYSISPGNFK